MFDFLAESPQDRARLCGSGHTRREFLQIGSLAALGLSLQPDTPVTLSYRGDDFARAKERNRVRVAEAAREGRIDVLLRSELREIRRDVAALDHAGCLKLVPNDAVVIRIGGEAPYPFLQRMGVHIVTKEIGLPAPSAHAG